MQQLNIYANERVKIPPQGSGSLDGLSFAVKDVFQIKGEVSSAGNPDWLRTHPPAEKNAAVVEKLLRSGASLQGMTITDELMYSINGENLHYGTPVNTNAPGRIPGGSSSGSAAAVAAGLASFAIGTDTGGSVRVPSAYCGVFGIRPSHGTVSVDGLIPLAPSFDTVGWMAQDAATLLAVGKTLLGDEDTTAKPAHGFTRLIIAEDMWSLADEATRIKLESLLPAIIKLLGTDAASESGTDGLASDFANERDAVQSLVIAEEGLPAWLNSFRHIQGLEIWQSHGEWITGTKPKFGPGIADRFAWSSTLRAEEHAGSFALQQTAQARMAELLTPGTLIVAPTAPSAAPHLNGSGEDVEKNRSRTMQLCCVAGLSGLPQVSIPITGEDGLPIGLSFIAAKHEDLNLLRWVERVAAALHSGM
ncbi:amidase family protein [Paenibacillus sp. HB172176]|uniref:amidase family protein n=1 Tax=Paenibacillus sp. HB172176 TaxID=2493690 RepID=UPI00143B9EE9|nr:amidase family protein [Paenibacillus sp. HB172176]